MYVTMSHSSMKSASSTSNKLYIRDRKISIFRQTKRYVSDMSTSTNIVAYSIRVKALLLGSQTVLTTSYFTPIGEEEGEDPAIITLITY